MKLGISRLRYSLKNRSYRPYFDKIVTLICITATTVAALLIPGYQSSATAGTDSLNPGESISNGQKLMSPSGRFQLYMQNDGNLVEVFLGRPVWSSGTSGPGVSVTLQRDGNLVEYKNGIAIFNTGTAGSGANLARLQDDGNFVVYSPGVARWSNNPDLSRLSVESNLANGQELMSADRRYTLRMQTDGNLVVIGPNGPTWNSGPSGGNAVFARMQNDGNLVVYGPNGAMYNTRTAGSGSDTTVMQNDGNLVLYARGVAKWSNGQLISGGGDNYPSPWRFDRVDNDIDTWGYYNRECTSWSAWALHDRRGFEMPRAIGNASAWGVWARSHGYGVDGNAVVGAVAWWRSGALDGGYNVGSVGHVAIVSAVSGTSVTIEEYNRLVNGTPDGLYHSRVIVASSTQQVQYIHFSN